MTLLINFIDGFTSASEPTIPSGQEDYSINNNVSSPSTFYTIDAAENTSALVEYELERLVTGTTKRQTGNFTMVYDGSAWSISQGSFSGDAMIKSAITSTEHITLTMTTATGVGSLKYTSGNMVGAGYSGKIKLYVTLIGVA